MLAAAPGESLQFDHLADEPPPRLPAPMATGGKPLPAISRTKIKKLKARIEKIYEERTAREQRELVAPDPPPLYDEVYYQGVEWLEQLAGSPVEETRGKLTFDNSIWKSPGRRDPELP